MTEPGKISFGFSKLTKKSTTSLIKKPVVEKEKVEQIESFEDKNIKIKGAVVEEDKPLVIPLNDSKKNLLDRVREAKEERKKENIKKEGEIDNRPDSELTLDELAARELIRDAQNRLNNGTGTSSISKLVLPQTLENDTDAEVPTLDDYENIPITEFGKAMLRGMGWKDDDTSNMAKLPELRPKGLGLGANKLVKTEIVKDKDGKELKLSVGAFGKIIAGSYKGNYCQVQGWDDNSGRIIVKAALKGEILTLNELFVIPVTKEEYSKGSKVINNAKYEEYKEISENKKVDIKKEIKTEKSLRSPSQDCKSSSNDLKHDIKKENTSSDESWNDSQKRRKSKKDKSKYRDRSRSNSRERRRRNKSKHKYRSSDSEDSDYRRSKSNKKKSHKKSSKSKSKSRHRRSSSSSESDYRDRKSVV